MEAVEELERGREAYVRRAWTDAFERLSRSDRVAPLGGEDLELLATAAYMLGREDECDACRERAFHLHLDAGEPLGAARSAFWLCNNLILRGEMGRATGWLGRARRLVERAGRDCVEQGYLLLPVMIQQRVAGDLEAATRSAADAAAIGERFGDADLFALATTNQGILLALRWRVAESLELLDEAMLAVTANEAARVRVQVALACRALGDEDMDLRPRSETKRRRHIVVHHRITDRERFLATDPRDIAGNAPPGVRALQFLPARDASAADCLWEAEALEPLRGYLDAVTRGICHNVYFEVASESAMGLPETASATA